MARPPLAKAKILDAYVALLCDEGERAATMDATAARAEVSKGGLLYHFASKEALAQAVIGACEELAAQDCELMSRAPEASRCTSCAPRRNWHRIRPLPAGRGTPGAGGGGRRGPEPAAHQPGLVRTDPGRGRGPTVAQAIMLIGEGIYAHAGRPAWWHDSDFDARLAQLLELVPKLKKLGDFNQ